MKIRLADGEEELSYEAFKEWAAAGKIPPSTPVHYPFLFGDSWIAATDMKIYHELIPAPVEKGAKLLAAERAYAESRELRAMAQARERAAWVARQAEIDALLGRDLASRAAHGAPGYWVEYRAETCDVTDVLRVLLHPESPTVALFSIDLSPRARQLDAASSLVHQEEQRLRPAAAELLDHTLSELRVWEVEAGHDHVSCDVHVGLWVGLPGVDELQTVGDGPRVVTAIQALERAARSALVRPESVRRLANLRALPGD